MGKKMKNNRISLKKKKKNTKNMKSQQIQDLPSDLQELCDI